MPRAIPDANQQLRIARQARASVSFRAERRVQEAQANIDTVASGVPADLAVQLSDFDTRISNLETP